MKQIPHLIKAFQTHRIPSPLFPRFPVRQAINTIPRSKQNTFRISQRVKGHKRESAAGAELLNSHFPEMQGRSLSAPVPGCKDAEAWLFAIYSRTDTSRERCLFTVITLFTLWNPKFRFYVIMFCYRILKISISHLLYSLILCRIIRIRISSRYELPLTEF